MSWNIAKNKKTRKQEKKNRKKQKVLVWILCFYFFVTPVEIQCPSQYINQALLLNSFFIIFNNLLFLEPKIWALS